MKGHKEIITVLNDVLVGELTAINQYFLHARMCDNWGFRKLGAFTFKESIEEMKHAQTVIDRILFLEGIPNLQKLDKINIGETVPEQLSSDLALEHKALARLKTGIEVSLKHSDHVTRDIFEKILKDEEEHVDWLETQIGIIKDVGRENYLAQQLST